MEKDSLKLDCSGKHPKEWTDAQKEEAVQWLVNNKTTKQMRKFQDLNDHQQHLVSVANNISALLNLQVMYDCYTEAINRIENNDKRRS